MHSHYFSVLCILYNVIDKFVDNWIRIIINFDKMTVTYILRCNKT